MKVTFCTTCMGRAHHLKQTLPRNLAGNVDWSKPDKSEFVVLDYSSPDDLGEWINSDPALKPYLDAGILRYSRVEGMTHFRHSHAKNLAHAQATGEIVCNVDSDNYLGDGFVDYLLRIFNRTPNVVVATSRLSNRLHTGPWKGSMGRIAMLASNFWALGGYDESDRFRGWSGEDTDLMLRAVRSGIPPVLLRNTKYLRVILHSDEERIQNTDFDDAAAELAKVSSLDGSHATENLRFLYRWAKSPRIANQVTRVPPRHRFRPWLARTLSRPR